MQGRAALRHLMAHANDLTECAHVFQIPSDRTLILLCLPCNVVSRASSALILPWPLPNATKVLGGGHGGCIIICSLAFPMETGEGKRGSSVLHVEMKKQKQKNMITNRVNCCSCELVLYNTAVCILVHVATASISHEAGFETTTEVCLMRQSTFCNYDTIRRASFRRALTIAHQRFPFHFRHVRIRP